MNFIDTMIRFIQKEYSLFSRGLRFFKELDKIEELPISKEEFYIFILEPFKRASLNRFTAGFESIEDKLNDYYKSEFICEILGKIGTSFLMTWMKEHGYPSTPNKILKCPRLNEALDWVYNKILKLPKRYILKSLGQGMYGVCFDYPFGRIEKISYSGFTPEEKKFYLYLLKNNNISISPRIYSLESDQVIMEKVVTDHPKLNQLRALTNKYINSQLIGSNGFDMYRDVKWKDLEKDLKPDHWFRKLIYTVSSELNKIFGKPIIGDFHASNFGVRPRTGELVYFDPIGGKVLMS